MAEVKKGVFNYDTNSIAYIIQDNRISLRGIDVAKILGFDFPYFVLKQSLDPEDGFLSEGYYFIYESGIYTLISKSKNKEKSSAFKKWIIKEIDKKKNEQIDEIRRYSLRLKNKAIESKKRKKEQIVYISSSVNCARQHRYKIGGVGSPEKLVPRLSNYNSRSPEGDEWQYYFKMNVSNFRQFENRFWDLLSDFRDKPKKEIIKMYFKDLKEVFTMIAEHYNKEVDFLNIHLQRFIENINYNRMQTIPVPIETGVVEKKKVKKSYVILPSCEELKREIKKFMRDRKTISTTPSVVFQRSEIIEHCIEKFKKFSKRDAWRIMKEISEEQKEFRLIY